jgi:hypothetical protein
MLVELLAKEGDTGEIGDVASRLHRQAHAVFWNVYLVKHARAKASQQRFERYERCADDADVDFDGGPCHCLDA